MHDRIDRRDFLRTATAAGVGLSLGPTPAFASSPAPSPARPELAPMDVVRVGFVGLGNQGPSHVENLLKIEGAEIVALCDLEQDRVAKVQDLCVKAGKPKPAGYWGGPTEFRKLCDRNDVDLVY